ncbi:MAG: glycosyltransferase family 39 protein, partial [Gammaproteobacteria bacterium]
MKQTHILPPVALLLMVAISYYPAYFAGFVWDDKVFLEAAPVQTLSGLMEIWFNPGSIQLEAHYWPMVFSSFWLEHRLWGYNPVGFHISNVLLHGIITLLLWRLLLQLTVPGAWLIAALFALHPAHVEAVAWTMGRKDLLATLFYLLAAGCWLRFQKRQQVGTYLIMLALFAAGMFSKSFVITLPAMLLVWAWWKRGRVGTSDLLQVVPLFLIGIIIAAGDLAFYSSRAEIDFHFSFPERLIIASKSLWLYVGTLLWPHPLAVIYPLWDTSPAELLNWLPLLAALTLALTLWLARHRIGRGPLVGVLFYAITLSPMLGFANNSYMEYSFTADRYLYLPIVG